jgi:hypothetical protein
MSIIAAWLALDETTFLDPVGLRAYAFVVYVTDPCLGSNYVNAAEAPC